MKILSDKISRIKGAIASGHTAARLAILIQLISIPCKLIDKLLSFLINNKNKRDSLPPCLMIVSPPRSGSTITYQVLTRVIPSVYISNLHALFPGFASYYMKKKKLFGVNLYSFNNYYGYTSKLNDINEGNSQIDYIFKNNAGKSLVRRRFIRLINKMGASNTYPFIFKNVRNYKNILRLHEAVPELIFLRIKRNPEQVIQSELKAHYELGTFHPIPHALSNISFKNDPVDFAVRQILEIEHEINEQKRKINSSNWIEWNYEDFCVNTAIKIEELAIRHFKLDFTQLRLNALKNPLKVSIKKKVTLADEDKIKVLLKKYSGIMTEK